MAPQKFSTEQIIRLLLEVEVELADGQSNGVVCKKIGVTTAHRDAHYRE